MSEFPAQHGGRAAMRPERRRDRQAAARRPAEAAREHTPEPLPFELAAFEGMVDPALLYAAARRAARLNVGGDEVLRCHGILSADLAALGLAARLGLEIDPLDDDRPPRSTRLLAAACTGVLARVGPQGEPLLTLAPRGHGIRRLGAALANDPGLAQHLRLAAPERLAEHVRRVGATELAREAVLGLRMRRPDLSARGRGRHYLHSFAVLCGAAALLAGVLAFDPLLQGVEIFLAVSFLAWSSLRIYACGIRPVPAPARAVPDRSLPIYTLVVPLYREAHMVPNLISALRRLDYPPEKLDIKLVVEADDPGTRAAVTKLALPAPFETILAPRAGPRTKPKALAAALPFARGSFLVVYDAEDEPEPGQLRAALAAFLDGPPELACVQARLAIDNVADGWLTRQFAAEYAGQFDVFLPALAELGLPLPLGGTSNHFRAEALREVGGWDPFNVTEDADLGMRLARFGFKTGVIGSTTWEEAPARLQQWLRQRTRWCKGWLQTWTVHMRRPLRLLRELGAGGFVALQLLVGGTVLAALVHPLFLGMVITDAATGTLFMVGETAGQSFRRWLALTTLTAGYVSTLGLAFLGLWRRRMLGSAWVLATIPAYWLLLSIAAWRAAFQLVVDPHGWEKTEHGLARTSLRAATRKAARRVIGPVGVRTTSGPAPAIGVRRPHSNVQTPAVSAVRGFRPRPIPIPDR